MQKVYRFELQTMPVQKRSVMGETTEIRCRLVREGDYDEARYFIRYFQPDGRGELRLGDGVVFAPNDLYPLIIWCSGSTTLHTAPTSRR